MPVAFGSPAQPTYNLELAENNASPWSRREPGKHSLRMRMEYQCWHAGLTRKVKILPGSVLVLSGYNRVWCAQTWGDRSETDVNVASFVGLDLGGDVIKWQQLPNPHFTWETNQWPVSAPWAFGAVTGVALLDEVGVYLRCNVGWAGVEDAGGPPCRWSKPQMCAFWDDVSLDVTAPAVQVPPVPPPAPAGRRGWEISVDVGSLRIAGTVTEL